ncbi:uncharacterized protein LOC121869635 [Homarus americanus]|uniref:uncharacterized protein LOC121869635 n=1 Tax=Homarus americanus TaxID=6706 RepID=UPI001C4887A9|nr:uncharacterized protein LOC121869635 [Homarus americanus]
MGLGVSDGVGLAMQQLLGATHSAMKTAVEKAIEELGSEEKIRRSLLQDVPVAAVTVAWRVWWAAGIDLAFHTCPKGARQVLRQKLFSVNEDIAFLLTVMGRGQQQKAEEVNGEYQEEPILPLSSVRTASGPSCRTTRRTSVTPVPTARCLPLLMATIHARDVISRLIRHNANCVENFTWISLLRYSWQSQTSKLELHAAHRVIDYDYEYSGCGRSDFVITPTTERTMLALLTAVIAHTPPLLIGKGGVGRQNLVEAVAHFAGRFTTTFTLSALTPSSTLTSLLAGSLIGGSWLFLRDCTRATPMILATLAATLLNIHHAHTFTSSSPVIQIAGQEVNLHAGAAVLLSVTTPQPTLRIPQGFGSTRSLPYSLEALSRPVWILTPPAHTLVFSWLHANAVPKAQEISEAIGEVVRQVLGSMCDETNHGLRLQVKLVQEVINVLATAQYTCTAMEAAVLAFKSVIAKRLARDSMPAVSSVLKLLHPPGTLSPPIPDQHEESARSLISETILQKMGLKIHLQQIKTVEVLAKELGEWSCVVVVGPPRSGKTSIINAAIKLYQVEYDPSTSSNTCQNMPSAANKSTRSQGLEQSLSHRSQISSLDRDTISFDETDGIDIDILKSNKQIIDQHLYALRPHSYSQTRLLGSATQEGLLPRLICQMANGPTHSFVVIEGKGASECLLRLQDIPGTLLLDSLHALPANTNLTFIVEARSLEEVPQWVLVRSGIVQIDPCSLSLATLMPKPEFIPPTPTTDRHSISSATPRSASKPNTPVSGREEELSPAEIMHYLLYRLLHPVLQLISDSSCGLHKFAVVDIMEQVQNLSMSDGDDVDVHHVTEKVQAVVQISRSIVDPTMLPELQQTLTTAIDKMVTERVLNTHITKVLQNLSSGSVPVYDQWWDADSSSWRPWQCALTTSDEDNTAKSAEGSHITPSIDTHRLTWLLKKLVKVDQPLVVVGPPACGKSTAVLKALQSLPDWATVKVNVTAATTATDIEDVVLNHLSRAAFDTLTPSGSVPVVICFDDIGSLSVGSSAWSFIEGLAHHKGMYDTSECIRWMNLSHTYILCVCTQQDSKRATVQDFYSFSGWTVYSMGIDENACTNCVSSALMPIAPLQSQMCNTLMNITVSLAEKLVSLLRCHDEPFAPASKVIIIWHIAAVVRAAFISSSLFSLASSSSGLYILNVWLHAVTSEVLFSVYSNKVQELVWHEIQRCVIEGGIGIVDDLPKTPRVPVWLPNLGTNIALSDDIGPKYLAEETASTEITKVLISQGVDELMCSHRGITMGVALVVDAVYTLIRTHKTPFLLLLGPSSTDKDVIISMAATYLGVKKVTSDTEGEMLDLLGVIGDKSGDDGSLSSQTIMTHVPATLLQFPDVLRVVLDMASVEDVAYKRLCVVTGSKEEVWPLCQELKPAARHGQVICLPIFKTLQHEVFVQSLLKKNKFLQNEACGTLTEIADFITYVHESYCADEALTNANVAVNQLTYSSLKQLPAVTSLAKLVAAFSELLQQRKNEIQSKLNDLKTALHRVEELEDHIQGLRDSHSSLKDTLSQVDITKEKIKENLKKREADILTHENCVSELHKEMVVVEKSQEELSGEVAEYVEETKAPLLQVTHTVTQLDIHRIRKLLSRSPISAIQIVFECAVVLLGSSDTSWRAVRHAIQDDNFCSKLAAVCVPGLKQSVIATLTEKLEQIKMTSDHLSRVSDIGGLLLHFLRTVIFFWHRHHEDVQPRLARVQVLTDQKKQLQVEMATRERMVRMAREDVANLKSQLEVEEKRMSSLKKKKITIEEELESILDIINELNPHSERWRTEIESQELLSNQLLGKCLLAATSLTYLTPLLPELRDKFTQTWKNDLTTRGILQSPEHHKQPNPFRLVSHIKDQQLDIKEAFDYHLYHNAQLLIHDPHCLVEEYVSGGIWMRVNKGLWQEELKEWIRSPQHCVIYLRTEHSTAMEIMQCCINNGNKNKVLIILEDNCISAPCPLCSRHVFLNISFNHKGIVHQLVQTLLKWYDPRFEEEVQQVMQALSMAYTEKEKREANLLHAFIHASNLTSTTELTGFRDHINNLKNSTDTANKHESHMNDLTSLVADRYLHLAQYAACLHQMTFTLAVLNPSYALSLSLIQDNLAHKLTHLIQETPNGDERKSEEQEEEITEVVTSSVFELINMRLQLQHRLIVTVCFALAKLNMKCDSEDYIKAFLVPMNVEQMLWKDVNRPGVTKKQEHINSSKEEKDEEIIEEKVESEDSISDWIPKQCDWKSGRVLTHLSENCSSLFPAPPEQLEESLASQLLLWLSRDSHSWPTVFSLTDVLQQAAQRVLLSRHLREDLLVEAMIELVVLTMGNVVLKSDPGMLTQAILFHSRKHKTKRSGIIDILQINVSRGANPPRVLMEAARDAGLLYYKLTFLSLATASQQEIRRRVVMAARRKTWLILLDCEISPHNLSYTQAVLLSLPSTLGTPTIFCIITDVFGTVRKSHNAVVAQVERPVNLAASLASCLSIAYNHLQTHSKVSSMSATRTKAAVLTTAYIFTVLHVKGEHGSHCWKNRPPLTETLLVESLEFARNYACTASMSWDVLASILAKLVCGSAVVSQLDQQVINKVFGDHLNDQIFRIPSRAKDKFIQDHSYNQLETSLGDQLSSDASKTIFLHSLSCSDLTLNLQLPPQKAVESACEQVETREAELLGMYDGHQRAQQTQQILLALETFTETPYVLVPTWAVLGMIAELQFTLRGRVTELAAQVTREFDFETQAWQQEAESWDSTQNNAQYQLKLLEQAVVGGAVQPAQALLILMDLVRSFILHPDVTLSSVSQYEQGTKQTSQENAISVRLVRAVILGVKQLAEEWKERHSHLLSWAENETPPVTVRLGLLVSPGWWLTRLRQTVCTRAHWLLRGSLVYATPATVKPIERPPQGVYIDGVKLVGGCWMGNEVVPVDRDVENCPIILSLAVSHAVPPTPVGHEWIPVLERATVETPLFHALLPLKNTFTSCVPLYLLLH